MNLILTVVYALLAGLALLAGWLYPEVKSWSCMAAGTFAVYLILSLILTTRPVAFAARIAGRFWIGLSALLTVGLLLAYFLRQEGGWFLAAAALTAFNVVVTLIIALFLKPESAALKR